MVRSVAEGGQVVREGGGPGFVVGHDGVEGVADVFGRGGECSVEVFDRGASEGGGEGGDAAPGHGAGLGVGDVAGVGSPYAGRAPVAEFAGLVAELAGGLSVGRVRDEGEGVEVSVDSQTAELVAGWACQMQGDEGEVVSFRHRSASPVV
jgi:hypothetical protein